MCIIYWVLKLDALSYIKAWSRGQADFYSSAFYMSHSRTKNAFYISHCSKKTQPRLIGKTYELISQRVVSPGLVPDSHSSVLDKNKCATH